MSSNQAFYVKSWLDTYANKNTRKVFSVAVKHFLSSVYGKPVDNGSMEQLAAQYIAECKAGRDWFKDLLKFAADLHDRPPKSASAFMSGVRSWLEFTLDVELSRKQMRLLRGRLPKGSKARTEEAELTREVLRRILTHTDVKGRALFLFLAASGVRVGEALQLKLDDLNLDADPPEVYVRGEYTKSGDRYQTFLTSEAKEALLEWLKVRQAYLESSANRGRGLAKTKRLNDNRVFPFSLTVAEQMWRNAIEKAKMADRDSFTNRHKLHIHMLRKFFLSQCKIAVPESVAEAWVGHVGYLDDAYRRYSKEQMREFYRKAEPYLLINVPKDIAEIQTKFQNDLDELREQVADLTRKLTDANAINLQLMNENKELRSRVEDLEKQLEKAMKILDELESILAKLKKRQSE